MVLPFDGPIVPPSRRKRRSLLGTPRASTSHSGKGWTAPAGLGSGGASDSLYSIKWKFVRDDDGEEIDYSPAVSVQSTTRRMYTGPPPGVHEEFPAPPLEDQGENGDGQQDKKDREDLSSLVQLLEELRSTSADGSGNQFFSRPQGSEGGEFGTEQVLQSIENEMPRELPAGDRKQGLVPRPPATERSGGTGRRGRGGHAPRSHSGSRQGTPSSSWGGSDGGFRRRPERGSRRGFSNASRSTATVQALMHGYVYPQERRRMLHTAAPRMTMCAQHEWQSFQKQLEDERGSNQGGGEGSDGEGKDTLLDDEDRDAAEEAGSGAKDASRPGSPVILWRPSARVRLALDLPTELLQGDLLRDSDEEDSYEDYEGGSWDGSEGGMSGYTWDSDYYYFHKVWPPVESSFGQYHEPRLKRRYGAWYIPPDLWGKELARREQRERGVAVTPEPMEAPDEGMDLRTLWQEKPLTEQQRQERAMAQQIQTVHSSKMYKAYIRDHHYRVPHYLQRVETPPKANPHKSRRGARGGSVVDDGEFFPPIA